MKSAGNLPYVIEAISGRSLPGFVLDGCLLIA